MNQPSARRPARPLPRVRVRLRRRALAAALAAAFSHAPGAAWAQVLPAGAQVVNGSADINSSNGSMTIRNSPNAILNWQSFSIGRENTVVFLQDNAGSKVLNRVVGNDPSNILGSLSSNGQVWLVNPNGVLFGTDARVNVGALVASTLGISDQDFLGGRFAFGADGVAGGPLQNQGRLTATGDGTSSLGGRVWLVGGSVRNDTGSIIQGGQIVLAAGQSVDLVDSGVPNVTVRVSATGNEVVNLGQLLAPGGGSIDLHGAMVNQNGIARATSLDTTRVGHIVIHAVGDASLGDESETSANGDANAAGGQVVVESEGGTTSVQGRVLATSAGFGGGQIRLLGPSVQVNYMASVDASGAASGGQVLVGTPQADAGPVGSNARNVSIDEGAQLKAGATQSGNGGSIVVRSDGATSVAGSLEAQGGPNGGQGGTVETSGAVVSVASAPVVSGADGNGGTWLLKAGDITVAGDTCPTCAPARAQTQTQTQETVVSNTVVQDALAQGTQVQFEAGGNLAVNASIATGVEQAPGAALTLAANNDVSLAAGVNIGAAYNRMPVSLIAGLDGNGAGAIRLGSQVNIFSGGGDLRLGGGTAGATLAQSVALAGVTLDAGSGNLYVNASTLTNNGFSVMRGGFIGISGRTLGLKNLAIEANGGGAAATAGSIEIGADTVTFTGTQVSADNKLYVVGTSAITLDNSTLSAGAGGDAITLSTASLTARQSQLSTPSGRWLTYLDSVSALSPALLESLDYSFVQVGAAPGATPALSGPGKNGFIVSAPMNVLVHVDATRVYDGTTQASFSTALGSDLASPFALQRQGSGVTQGRFADKNAGIGKTVFVDDATAPFAITTSTGQPVYGANQTYAADVTPKSISASLSGVDKVYDGNRTAAISGTLSGAVAGDDVHVNTAGGLFDTKDAGAGKTITLTDNPLSGADAGNYSVDSLNRIQASITPRPITLGGVTALDKVYDGTRSAALSGSLADVLAGDAVSVSGASGLFADKNAGVGKTVAIAGATLAGADAGNYTVAGTATVQASITPRPLTVTGLTALDKVYDGNRMAVVSASITGALPGDAVSLDTTGQFDTRNVGAAKTVALTGALGGTDAGNYTVSLPASTSAAITARLLDIVLTGDVRKEYDATAQASLAPDAFRLDGVVAGDSVAIRGPAQGSFASPDVGRDKPVSASGAFVVSGADASNYRIGSTGLTATSNTVQATVTADIGLITPATLVYVASPATGVGGLPSGPLGGTVTGFKGSDTLASATSGTLQWNGAATPASAPGAYAVVGSGLSAANYLFVQAPGNATALDLEPALPVSAPQPQPQPQVQVQVQDDSIQAIASAVRAALPANVSAATALAMSGAVFDRSGVAPARTFEPVRVGSMSQDELGRLLADRRDFKRKLFADAIYKLTIDPSLADIRPCGTAAEAASGTCRITPDQVAALQVAALQAAGARAAATQAPAPAAGAASSHGAKARVVNLPRIERKIIVLFGVNAYADKNIPELVNAVPDADAVGKVFADKLGYEVRVVHNPDKATIVRTLNALAAEAGSADSVAVYYAGHGISLNKDGAGYWLAADASVTDPKSWISNADIARLLSGIRSKQVTLISDSCYSGAFAREGLGAIGQHVSADDVLAKRSVVVLSSGGDEPVPDSGKNGHSIFAWYLMRVIGSVTAWQQGSTIFSDVQAAVRKEFPQTPRYGSLTAAGHQAGGDYLFESRSN